MAKPDIRRQEQHDATRRRLEEAYRELVNIFENPIANAEIEVLRTKLMCAIRSAYNNPQINDFCDLSQNEAAIKQEVDGQIYGLKQTLLKPRVAQVIREAILCLIKYNRILKQLILNDLKEIDLSSEYPLATLYLLLIVFNHNAVDLNIDYNKLASEAKGEIMACEINPGYCLDDLSDELQTYVRCISQDDFVILKNQTGLKLQIRAVLKFLELMCKIKNTILTSQRIAES